ncbi:MAG: amino acid permease [Candidatus Kapaibacterium sp.]
MDSKPHLKRALGLYATTAIVIGSVVGSGIFSSPSQMARDLPSAPLLLGVWLFTGILTLFGALTQSELVGQMPRTGGLYEYFREIYGEQIGFLYGWANFTIAGSGAIAAIAFIFANYLGEFVALPKLSPALEATPLHLPMLGDIFPLADMGVKCVAAGLVIFLTILNVRGVKVGARLQSISTTTKMIAILGVVAIAFFLGAGVGHTSNWFHAATNGNNHAGGGLSGNSLSGWGLVGAISLAMSGAFWAYDGWGNVAYIAGEVKEPSRTIPRAIILGTFTFISLYMLVNLAYFYILPVEAVGSATGDRVASVVITQVIGGFGGLLIAGLIMLSTFDTTNSSILTNARVYFAMGQKRVFYEKAAVIHPKFQTPYVSLLLQGGWALVLLFSGSFGLITDMYVFVNWLLYVLMALGVFILRRRLPQGERPFKVPGYPWIPAIFVLFASAFVIITLVTDVQAYRAGAPLMKSVTGLVLVLSGLPFYYFWKYKQDKALSITSLDE